MAIVAPQWSLAHRQLLNRFAGRPRLVYPSSPDDWDYSRWKAALGESQQEAIGRFLDAGFLVHCTVPEQLDWGFSLSQLRGFLRERSLKLSGTKAEIADRLYRADAAGMERAGAAAIKRREIMDGLCRRGDAVSMEKAQQMRLSNSVPGDLDSADAAPLKKAIEGYILVKCSESGLRLVSEYTKAEKKMSQKALDALQNSDLDLAISTVLSFENELGFPPFPNPGPSAEEVHGVYDRMRRALDAKPKILSGINCDAMAYLRFAAAAVELYALCRGEIEGRCFAPDPDVIRSLKTGLNMDNQAALNMVNMHLRYQRNKETWMRISVAHIRLCGARDPDPMRARCQSCRELDGREWPIEEVPDLPYQHCTSKFGCRCMAIPTSSQDSITNAR